MPATIGHEDRPRHKHPSQSPRERQRAARELLLVVIGSPEHTLLLSPFLLQELERVFGYERVRNATRLTEKEIIEYLAHLRSKDVSELIFPGAAPRVVPFDEQDDPVVHTAIVGKADALCTLNRHFYVSPVVEYCKDRGLLLASDVDLLRTLRGDKEPKSGDETSS